MYQRKAYIEAQMKIHLLLGIMEKGHPKTEAKLLQPKLAFTLESLKKLHCFLYFKFVYMFMILSITLLT